MTQLSIYHEDIYQTQRTTVVVNNERASTEDMLIDRYIQNNQRMHFEQLLLGELKTLPKCSLIYPYKLPYVHFQLLSAFTHKLEQYTHFIDHESTLRAGALMESLEAIKNNNASLYFVVPLSCLLIAQLVQVAIF